MLYAIVLVGLGAALAGFCLGRLTAPRVKTVEVERLVDPDIGRRYQAMEEVRKLMRGHVAAREQLHSFAAQKVASSPAVQRWLVELEAKRRARDTAPDLMNDPRYWALRASGKLWTKDGYAEVVALRAQLERGRSN